MASAVLSIALGGERLASAPTRLDELLAAIGIGSGLLEAAGLLTPFAASTLGFTCLAEWLGVPRLSPFLGGPDPLFRAAVHLAIALLGPGAISIDARVFGRRRIIIPVTRK